MYLKKEGIDKTHPCYGCFYWRDSGICYACNYMLVEGHRRGCDPGAACDKRIMIDPVRRAEILRANFIRMIQSV